MARIKKLDLDDWDKDLREMTAADSGTPLEQGAMRMFAHTPEISKGLTAFAGSLKQNRSLPDRLVELVRLRVAFITNAEAVWLSDIKMARKMELLKI